jgi:hypothetical protein
MTEIEYKVADLINFSSSQKPYEFDQAFRSIVSSRVGEAIADKKISVAKSMFGNDSNSQEEELDA